MQKQRQFRRDRAKFELFLKILLLHINRAELRAVVVEPKLSNSHNAFFAKHENTSSQSNPFILRKQFDQFVPVSLINFFFPFLFVQRQFAAAGRMDTKCCE